MGALKLFVRFKLPSPFFLNVPLICTLVRPSLLNKQHGGPLGARNHWHTSGSRMALCSFRGPGVFIRGWSGAWGSGCLGLCVRPFSSTSGPRKTEGRRKPQHPSPSPNSSTICAAELDGPAAMGSITVPLFLVLMCCVGWGRAEGKDIIISTIFFESLLKLCQLNGSLSSRVHLLLTHKSHYILQRSMSTTAFW